MVVRPAALSYLREDFPLSKCVERLSSNHFRNWGPAVIDMLQKIVDHKWTEIEAAKQNCPFEELQAQLADAPPVRDFYTAIRQAKAPALIAEVKRASPSAGLIRPDFSPVEIATLYEKAGATCLSVLTDEHFFQGHLDYLKQIRQQVSIPVMRKEFILDRYQLLEARIAGADAALLIAECLDEATLKDLYEYAHEIGLATLVELYEPENLQRVLDLNAPLIGVNNRDLRNFTTDLQHCIRLHQKVPEQTLFVAESGIHTPEHVQLLRDAQIDAMLVGESLMRADCIETKVQEILA